jgi:hypothetical protein
MEITRHLDSFTEPEATHDAAWPPAGVARSDPGRKFLDQIETGVRPTARRRHVVAVLEPPGISYADWLRQHGYEELDRRMDGGNR